MLQTVKQINTEQFVVQLQIFTKFLPKLSFCPELYQTVILCFITCDNVMTHISHRMIQLMRRKVSTHTHSLPSVSPPGHSTLQRAQNINKLEKSARDVSAFIHIYIEI